MLNNKDVGFNDETQTLTINGKKHHIGGSGEDTGCVTFAKTATGWRATPAENSRPLLYFYIP